MRKIRERSLRLESLEDRMLLAVTAGSESAAVDAAAPAQTGAEIVVDELTVTALNNAIRNAKKGDVITFSQGGTITVGSTPIQMRREVTIDGGGQVTIDGQGENRLFQFSYGCTLTGINLTGGFSTGSSFGGVGTVNEANTVILNNCNIYGNSVDSYSGGTNAYFGGAFKVYGVLEMHNCSVYNNTAWYGGFAQLDGVNSTKGGVAKLTAENCVFYGNRSKEFGSVIYNMGGTVALTHCTVAGNSSPIGGAIVNVSHLDVTSNSAVDPSGTDYQPDNPYFWNLKFYVPDTQITDSIVAYNYGTDSSIADFHDIYNRVLHGNGVQRWAFNRKDDFWTKVSTTNSIVGLKGDFFTQAPVFDAEGNLVNADSLDLTINSDSLAAYAGIGANPTAYTGAGYSDASLVVTTLEDSIDSADGAVSLREAIAYAAIGSFAGTPTITFADGLADGTITLAYGALGITSDVNIAGGNITIDAAGTDRALYMRTVNYRTDIEGCYRVIGSLEEQLSPHQFDDEYYVDVTIDGLNFTGGEATCVVTAVGNPGGSSQNLSGEANILSKGTGGAGVLANENVNLTLSNSTISGNTFYVDATNRRAGGGGIAVLNNSTAVLSNVKVLENTVVQKGEYDVDNTLKGGGIYIGYRSTLDLSNSEVSGNTLTATSYQEGGAYGYGHGFGGGICTEGIGTTISYSVVSGNTIAGAAYEQFGGGIYYYHALTDSVLADNDDYQSRFIKDYSSGDTEWQGFHYHPTAAMLAENPYALVLDNTVITGNSVGDHNVVNNGFCAGGGVYTSGKALLVNNLIADNSLDAGNAEANLTGKIHGGGVYNETVKDALYGHKGGDSIYFNDTAADIYYSTIAGNSVGYVDYNGSDFGGGFYDAAGVSSAFVGNVLVNNVAVNTTTGAKAANDIAKSGNSFTLTSSVYSESGVKGTGYTFDACINYSGSDPLFVDADNSDYRLVSNSVAVDALAASAPTPGVAYEFDVRNDPYVRVYNSVQDLGCYEFQNEVAPAPTFEVTVVGYEGDYDGSAHTVSISGLEAGDTVLYSADGQSYSADVVAYTEAGSYTVYVKVQRAGYQDFTGSGSVVINEAAPSEPLATPTISTGSRGVYVSYGANRHYIQWGAVANASGYEVQYTTDGSTWSTVAADGTAAVIGGLTYGADVTYRVRALGEGSYTDSQWSRTKTFNVCPMDINNDGDIGGLDRNVLASSWGAEEGDDEYKYYADINADDDVGGLDRNFLGSNWGAEAGDDDLSYPRPVRAADAVFAAYEAGDLDVEFDAF